MTMAIKHMTVVINLCLLPLYQPKKGGVHIRDVVDLLTNFRKQGQRPFV